jgi:hypothetical protein
MSLKNEAMHLSNCPITTETTVIVADSSSSNVPSQRKEAAKQTLYLNRI